MCYGPSEPPTRPTGQTPFFLVYGAEAVLPTELKHGSPRVLAYEDTQAEQRIDDINVLEEMRCRASLRSARYQQGLRRYHSHHVQPQELQLGDLILRKIQDLEGLNKLSSKWQGPLWVTHTLRPRRSIWRMRKARRKATPRTLRICGSSTPDYKHESHIVSRN